MSISKRDQHGESGESNRESNGNNNYMSNVNVESRNSNVKPKRFKEGTAILKMFEGTTYRGIITRRFNGSFYHITYGDGDEEDLEHEEVEALLENKNGDNFESDAENRKRLM